MIEALVISNLLAWVCLVGLALVVFALVRQIGVLHERLRPVGALLTRDGPAVGEQAPVQEVPALDGSPIAIGGRHPSASSTLLFFLSPSCPVCKVLLPTLVRTVRAEKDTRLVLASDGLEHDHRGFAASHGLGAYPYVVSSELGLTYRVGKLPYAVLIDAGGVVRAKGIVNSREHLDSLFEAKRRGVSSIQELLVAGQPDVTPGEAA